MDPFSRLFEGFKKFIAYIDDGLDIRAIMESFINKEGRLTAFNMFRSWNDEDGKLEFAPKLLSMSTSPVLVAGIATVGLVGLGAATGGALPIGLALIGAGVLLSPVIMQKVVGPTLFMAAWLSVVSIKVAVKLVRLLVGICLLPRNAEYFKKAISTEKCSPGLLARFLLRRAGKGISKRRRMGAKDRPSKPKTTGKYPSRTRLGGTNLDDLKNPKYRNSLAEDDLEYAQEESKALRENPQELEQKNAKSGASNVAKPNDSHGGGGASPSA